MIEEKTLRQIAVDHIRTSERLDWLKEAGHLKEITVSEDGYKTIIRKRFKGQREVIYDYEAPTLCELVAKAYEELGPK